MLGILKFRHFGSLGGSLFPDVGGRAFLAVKEGTLDCDFGDIFGWPALGQRYLVRDLDLLGRYFSWVFFLIACSSSCRILNFLK